MENTNLTPAEELELEAAKEAVRSRAEVAVLEFGHDTVIGLIGGMRNSKQIGMGYKLQRIKEFDPEMDDPRTILHTATAMYRGKKIFCLRTYGQRDMPIYVLVDLNKTLKFGSTRVQKLRLAAEMVATIIQSIYEARDRVGFIAYANNQVIEFRRPGPPGKVMDLALDTILRPPHSTGHLDNGLIAALDELPQGKKCAVICVSDWLNLTEEQKVAMAAAAENHEIIAVTVSDQREKELPEDFGFIEICDMRTGHTKTVLNCGWTRASYRQAYLDHATANEAFFEGNDIRHVSVMTQEGPDELLERLNEVFAVPLVKGGV